MFWLHCGLFVLVIAVPGFISSLADTTSKRGNACLSTYLLACLPTCLPTLPLCVFARRGYLYVSSVWFGAARLRDIYRAARRIGRKETRGEAPVHERTTETEECYLVERKRAV